MGEVPRIDHEIIITKALVDQTIKCYQRRIRIVKSVKGWPRISLQEEGKSVGYIDLDTDATFSELWEKLIEMSKP